MQCITKDVLKEILIEVENLLKKHNISWNKLDIWETSDGYLIEIESPNIKDDLQGISLSRKLEKELKDPTVTLSILPAD
jgi:hypothetical protein